MKKVLFLILFLSLASLPKVGQAFTVKNTQVYNLPAESTLNDNLYLAGNDLSIDGKIDGDLKFIGSNLTINGEVNGDIIGIAENININGKVNGNLRIAGEQININGQIIKNADMAGSKVNLASSASIGKDLLIAANEVNIDGVVQTDLHGLANSIKLNGQIGRNVFLRFLNEEPKKEILEIGPSAKINGSLNYTAKNNAKISDINLVSGGIHHTPIDEKFAKQWQKISLWNSLMGIFSALVIGLVLTSLFGKKLKSLNTHISHRPSLSALIGLATMFSAPFLIIILFFTLIGIPLALIALVCYLVLIYLSRIIIAIYVGGLMVKKAYPEQTPSVFWSMIIGIVVSWLFFSLPVIGWFLSIIATWWGIGAILIYFKEEISENRLPN